MPALSGHPVTPRSRSMQTRALPRLRDYWIARVAGDGSFWVVESLFGSFSSMLSLSMMTCLMNTRGSTLSPLR